MDVDVANATFTEVDVADADIEITDNERQTMLDLFAEACARHTAWDDIDLRQQGSIVRRLERGCHNSAVHSCEKDRINCAWDNPTFTSRYSAICYRVLSNLDPRSSIGSEYLGNLLITGEIDARAVSMVSSATLYPAGSATERDIIATRMKQKIQEKFSQKYKCSKCQARKCVWYGVQMRGLDEPEDKHCKCLECGHEWKERE